MMRSMPAFMVTVEAGQLTQAPCSSTVTTPVLVVDLEQRDVTTVGLDGRPDDLDDLFNLDRSTFCVHARLRASRQR